MPLPYILYPRGQPDLELNELHHKFLSAKGLGVKLAPGGRSHACAGRCVLSGTAECGEGRTFFCDIDLRQFEVVRTNHLFPTE